MPTRKWGSEKLVNAGSIGDFVNAEVAGLTGGGFVVVWQDNTPADSAVRAQRYDAAGNTVGSEMTVSAVVGNASANPSVTALSDGGFLVNFDFDAGTENYIHGKVFNTSGGFVRDQHTFPGGQDRFTDNAWLGNGSVVTWQDPEANDGDIVFRIFDAAGAGGATLTANTTTTGVQIASSVSAAPSGSKFAITWSNWGSSVIEGRLFNANGTEFAAQFTIGTSNIAGGFIRSGVTWLNNDQFAVTWTEKANDQYDVWVKIFDGRTSTVTSITGDILVNSTTASYQTSWNIVALPTGGFVVVWEDESGIGGDSSGSSIKLQAFDGSGGKIGGETLVNTTVNSYQDDPSVSVLSDGRVVVSWIDRSSGSDQVRVQIVDPRDGIVNGTLNADTLYGHDAVGDDISGFDGADTIFGLAGNDTIWGGNGIDTINGGKGDDFVYGGLDADHILGEAGDDELYGEDGGDDMWGGAGADLLDGGAGADKMDGGAGEDTMAGGADSDIYIVDTQADVIGETAGNGTADRVMARVSYALAADDDIELLTTISSTATTAIDLTGNALKQEITGNYGDNILRDGPAGGAADVLKGLNGNDTYQIYNSATTIVESISAAGGTADRVMAGVDYKLGAGVGVEIMTTNSSTGTSGIDLTGNEVVQAITGNAGSNILDGKGGNDTLTGLGGKDFFVFSSALGASNVDKVTDFNVTDDTIRLENAIFTALTSTGVLAAALFKDNFLAPIDADDRIIYNSNSGSLFYDADGAGGVAAVKFATLSTGLALTAADFVVI
jgi:Ca2+-binding RTX toxin-like protein